MAKTAVIFHSRPAERARIRSALDGHFQTIEAASADELDHRLSQNQPDLVFTELTLPPHKGLALVRRIRELATKSEVVVVSPVESPTCAVAAAKNGAFGFLTKHDGGDAILTVAFEAVEHSELSRHEQAPQIAELFAANNPATKALARDLPAIGRSGRHAIIAGEIGTGRRALARALHGLAPWPGVLRLVDCARAAQESLSSVLDVTEDDTDFPEREPLDNTICLLNLEELPEGELSSLAKLCHGPVRVRLSDGRLVPVRYRILGVCALRYGDGEDRPRVLEQMLAAPINAALVELPPLRHRVEDLPLLCAEEAERQGRKCGIPPKTFTADAIGVLATYAWPANLLELSNLVERITLTVPETVIDASAIPLEIHINGWKRGLTYRSAMERLEREFLLRILDRTGGCRRRAAERLQVSYSTLKFRLRKLAVGARADRPKRLVQEHR